MSLKMLSLLSLVFLSTFICFEEAKATLCGESINPLSLGEEIPTEVCGKRKGQIRARAIEKAKAMLCIQECTVFPSNPCPDSPCEKDTSTASITASNALRVAECTPDYFSNCTDENGEDAYINDCTVRISGDGKVTCDCKCEEDNSCQTSSQNTINSLATDECPDPGSIVKLSNFTAVSSNKGVSLNWITETEPDSQGFRIWRAIPKLNKYCGCSGNINDYTQIQVLDKEGKPILIPTKGNKVSGSNYSYLDKDAKPGMAYCYALEDIDSKGKSKFYFEYIAFTHEDLDAIPHR